MTVRNYRSTDVIKREPTNMVYDGHRLDHINYFKNGAVVGYSDADEKQFLVVLKAAPFKNQWTKPTFFNIIII